MFRGDRTGKEASDLWSKRRGWILDSELDELVRSVERGLCWTFFRVGTCTLVGLIRWLLMIMHTHGRNF